MILRPLQKNIELIEEHIAEAFDAHPFGEVAKLQGTVSALNASNASLETTAARMRALAEHLESNDAGRAQK